MISLCCTLLNLNTISKSNCHKKVPDVNLLLQFIWCIYKWKISCTQYGNKEIIVYCVCKYEFNSNFNECHMPSATNNWFWLLKMYFFIVDFFFLKSVISSNLFKAHSKYKIYICFSFCNKVNLNIWFWQKKFDFKSY